MTNLFDHVGRNYKTLHADGSVRQTVYGANGRRTAEIDPDGVTTLYSYDMKGQVEFVVTDMDRDLVIDRGGSAGDNDRVQQTVTVVTNKGSLDVRRSSSYVLAGWNSTNSTLLTMREESLDGRTTWIASQGVTNRTDQYFPSARDGNRYSTNTAPDGSCTVTHFFNGVVQSTTLKDSTGTQLSLTTYTYDAHGRQSATTDARSGTTTYAYDDADRRTSVTTPAPGTGQGAQTTTFAFDEMGRLTRTTYPDGTSLNVTRHALAWQRG